MSAAAVATRSVVTDSAAAIVTAAHSLPLPGLAHGHVLDLRLPRVAGAGQLEVADDLTAGYGDQDAAGADVGVEFRRGIFGQLEQRAQAVPGSAVGLDPYVVRHQGSLMSRSRRQRR